MEMIKNSETDGWCIKGTRNLETDVEEWKCKFCSYSHPLKKEKCPAWEKMSVFCEELNHFVIKCPKEKWDVKENLVTDDREASSGEEEWVNMVKSELSS